MANNSNTPYPDEEPVSGIGPRNWRRIYSAVVQFFSGGAPPGTGHIVSAAANDQLGVLRDTIAVYRAKQQQADAAVKNRIDQTKNKRRVFENDIRDLIEERLQLAFHPENYARLYFTLHVSTNVMNRILSETCVLYENPATRKLIDPDKDDSKDALPTPPTPPPAPVIKQKVLPPGQKPVPPGTAPAQAPAMADATTNEATLLDADPTAIQTELITGDLDIDRLAAILDLTGSEEEEDTSFQELMEYCDWDVLLDKVEKLCSICPAVWVRPYVCYDYNPPDENNPKPKPDPESGRLTYIIYTPENAGVVTNPSIPTEAIAWYYFADEVVMVNGELRTQTFIHYWDKDTYTKFDANWKVVIPSIPNYLGRLPAVLFQNNLANNGSYYCDGVGDDLFHATIEACVLKTLENQRFKDGAFKQLAIQGGDKTMADQVMGGPTPFFTGEDENVSVLDMQPNIEQMTKMWQAREDYIAATYGIDLAEYKGNGHPKSGFAKKLSQAKITKESKRRRKFFAKSEQELYELTALELKTNPVPDLPELNPELKLKVDFGEPTFEEDPQTEARGDALDIELNVQSILDILRARNPDLTDVELLKLAWRNREINKAFVSSKQNTLIDLLATEQGKPGQSMQNPTQGGAGGGDPTGGGNGTGG